MTAAAKLDAVDPLAHCRERFRLPDGVIYLDGNSLGALPLATPARLEEVAETQWGRDLIGSWNKHGWIDWPRRVAARLAPILGAAEDELLVGDSTSTNLFKLAMAAAAMRPERPIILTEAANFPSDLYMLQAVADQTDRTLIAVKRDELETRLDKDVALLALTHVDYRSGRRHDMGGLSRAAHEAGALALWDLSHSAGVLRLDLEGDGADFAVGCGYKYLNGGPGAPAFLYVRKAHQERASNPLPGWLGHQTPFTFEPDYRPAPGIARFQTGTPPILAMAALDEGLKIFEDVAMTDVEAKAGTLGNAFIDAVGDRLTLASPHEAAERGGHVVFAHDHAFGIVQAAIERGVVGDFREPNLARFGFAPLYLSHGEVARAGNIVRDIAASEAWREARFATRNLVT